MTCGMAATSIRDVARPAGAGRCLDRSIEPAILAVGARGMDFRLSPEQEEFRRTVARFVDAEVAPVARGLDEAGEFPRALFRRLGEQGYLGLRYPEAVGGGDADFVTYCLFAEELARGSMSLAALAAMQSLMGTHFVW